MTPVLKPPSIHRLSILSFLYTSSEELKHPTAKNLKSNPLPQAYNIANRPYYPPPHQNISNLPKNLRLETADSPFKDATNFLFPPSNSFTALTGNCQNDVSTSLAHGTSTKTPSNYDPMDFDIDEPDLSGDEPEDYLQTLNIHKSVGPTESTLPLSGYDPIVDDLNQDSGQSTSNLYSIRSPILTHGTFQFKTSTVVL